MKPALLIVMAAAAVISAQPIMTVEQAVSTALKNNFNIQIARNNAEIAENNTSLGTAGFLPRIDASAGKTLSNSKEKTTSPFSFGDRDTDQLTGRIDLNWTIFDGFSMFAANSRFMALAEAGKAQSRLQIENTVVSVLAAYFNVVSRQKLYSIARDNLALSRQRIEKEKIRKELGGVSSTDFLRSQVAFNADSAAFLQSSLSLKSAKNNFNRLLARDLKTPVTVSENILIPAVNRGENEWFELAMAKNAQLNAAKKSLRAAEKNITVSSAGYYPRLSVNGSYSYTDRTITNNSGDITTEADDRSVGLNLSFNIFNGLRDNTARQNAKLEARNRQLEVYNTELQIKAALEEKLINLDNRLKLLALEEQNASVAAQSFQLQKERYEMGTSTSLDFRDAQISLNRAQEAFIAAQYQARIAMLELEQLAGIIAIE